MTRTLTATAPVAEIYGAGLGDGRLYLRGEDGRRRRLPIARWLGPLGPADERALDRAVGPVLDVGCGPGRHVLALAGRGVRALGVDIAPGAIRHARGRGAAAVLGSVFDPVPGAGRWQTALLLDGNIGIGGRPAGLLARVGGLLGGGGAVICEVDPPGSPTTCELVALEDGGGRRSNWFPWAWVSADGVAPIAGRAGLELAGQWTDEGRWFVRLTVGDSFPFGALPGARREAAGPTGPAVGRGAEPR